MATSIALFVLQLWVELVNRVILDSKPNRKTLQFLERQSEQIQVILHA